MTKYLKYIWLPIIGLQWLGTKIRTAALLVSAARSRARLVTSTPVKRRYEDHLSGS